jgi:hypothetical protein
MDLFNIWYGAFTETLAHTLSLVSCLTYTPIHCYSAVVKFPMFIVASFEKKFIKVLKESQSSRRGDSERHVVWYGRPEKEEPSHTSLRYHKTFRPPQGWASYARCAKKKFCGEHKSCGRNLSLSCGQHICILRASRLHLAGITDFSTSHMTWLSLLIFFAGKAPNYISSGREVRNDEFILWPIGGALWAP